MTSGSGAAAWATRWGAGPVPRWRPGGATAGALPDATCPSSRRGKRDRAPLIRPASDEQGPGCRGAGTGGMARATVIDCGKTPTVVTDGGRGSAVTAGAGWDSGAAGGGTAGLRRSSYWRSVWCWLGQAWPGPRSGPRAWAATERRSPRTSARSLVPLTRSRDKRWRARRRPASSPRTQVECPLARSRAWRSSSTSRYRSSPCLAPVDMRGRSLVRAPSMPSSRPNVAAVAHRHASAGVNEPGRGR